MISNKRQLCSVYVVLLFAMSISSANGQSNSDSKVASLPQPGTGITSPDENVSTQTGDPTVPSPKIQRLLPRPEKLQVVQKTSTTKIIPLPKKPDVKLLKVELTSSTKQGKAFLEVDGRSISIELIPRDQQERIPLPPTQFVDYGAALAQRAALVQSRLTQDSGPAFEMKKHELCLKSSIVLDEVVLNLEQFTDNSLVFNVLPHDELILVRLEMPKTTDANPRPSIPKKVNPLPSIPDLKIRGIVLGSQNRGTALLEVDGKQVTIDLLPVDQQKRVAIPEAHFAVFRPAVAKEERETKTSTELTPAHEHQMCLRCSVVTQGVVFNLEGYSANSLSFRVLPHNETVLLRQ